MYIYSSLEATVSKVAFQEYQSIIIYLRSSSITKDFLLSDIQLSILLSRSGNLKETYSFAKLNVLPNRMLGYLRKQLLCY